MQYLWKNYTLITSKNPNGEGFTEWDFQKAIETVVGTVCDPFFSELIHGYNDLQLQIEESIGKNGLNLQVTKNILKKETLGVSADISAGKTIVKSVNRESLGEQLGLQPNDEIIAVNGFRVENNADELMVKTSVVNAENSGDAWGIRVPWIDLTTKDADPKGKSVNLLISRYGLLLQLNGAVFPTEEVQYKIKLPIQATQSKETEAAFWKSKGGIQHLLR